MQSPDSKTYGRLFDDRHISDYNINDSVYDIQVFVDVEDAQKFVTRIAKFFIGGRLAMTFKLNTPLMPHEQAALNAFLARIYEDHGDRIFDSILFGSKARGDSELDSDVDILLIVDREDWRFRHQISDIASDIALENDVLIGSIVIAKDRWEMMERERFSLYENVARDGISLPMGID